VKIEREYLALCHGAFDLDRPYHLAQFCREAALAARLQQPRHLHRDGGAARYDLAMGDELQRRPT
jgi:hypothetical protein